MVGNNNRSFSAKTGKLWQTIWAIVIPAYSVDSVLSQLSFYPELVLKYRLSFMRQSKIFDRFSSWTISARKNL